MRNVKGPAARGWRETTLGEVADFASGYAFSDRYQGGAAGVPFFKVSDMNHLMNRREMSVANNYVESAALKQMKAKSWPAGTVIFPKVGAALFTEKRRVLATDAAFDNNVMGLVPGPLLASRFLLYVMELVYPFRPPCDLGVLPGIVA